MLEVDEYSSLEKPSVTQYDALASRIHQSLHSLSLDETLKVLNAVKLAYETDALKKCQEWEYITITHFYK